MDRDRKRDRGRQTYTHMRHRGRQTKKDTEQQRNTYTERMNFIHQKIPRTRACLAWEAPSVVQNLHMALGSVSRTGGRSRIPL